MHIYFSGVACTLDWILETNKNLVFFDIPVSSMHLMFQVSVITKAELFNFNLY